MSDEDKKRKRAQDTVTKFNPPRDKMQETVTRFPMPIKLEPPTPQPKKGKKE